MEVDRLGLTLDDIRHVARLARLSLTEDELKSFESDLNNILRYVEQLREVDTEGVEPTSHAVRLENVMREDRVEPSLPVDEALANAPDRSDDYFRVPRILETEQ
jgi:aspartyl-tRNA(Asn)/glutamyl-tRNA(Gln) amidotransferase subunit C